MRAFTWLIQRFDKENRHTDRRGERERERQWQEES